MRRLNIKIHLIVATLITFGFSLAYATVSITGVAGASNFENQLSSPIIYGGTAGSDAGCPTSGTCNNCNTGSLVACNTARIVDSNELSITLKSEGDSGKDGTPIITLNSDSSGAIATVGSSVTKGNSATLNVDWSLICDNVATANSVAPQVNCDTVSGGGDFQHAALFRVGVDTNGDGFLISTSDDYTTVSIKVQKNMPDEVDPNGTGASGEAGITDFAALEGDTKVYIRDLEVFTGFPNSTNSISYKQMLLLYSAAGSCTNGLITNNNVGSAKYMSINSDGSLSDDRFLGFENDVSYMFKVAVQDTAGNIGLFTADVDCKAYHIATPGEVIGLLQKKQDCFIATATHGENSHLVSDLREFRSKILLKTPMGQKFVQWYYRVGAEWAQFLNNYPTIKPAVHALLIPVWMVALMILKWGWFVTMSCLLVAAFIGFKTVQALRRRLV